MYKYTISPRWSHYFTKKYGKYCRYYIGLPIDLFISNGWPNTYTCKYDTIHLLPDVKYYSQNKLNKVPVNGYLIPINFFKEEQV